MASVELRDKRRGAQGIGTSRWPRGSHHLAQGIGLISLVSHARPRSQRVCHISVVTECTCIASVIRNAGVSGAKQAFAPSCHSIWGGWGTRVEQTSKANRTHKNSTNITTPTTPETTTNYQTPCTEQQHNTIQTKQQQTQTKATKRTQTTQNKNKPHQKTISRTTHKIKNKQAKTQHKTKTQNKQRSTNNTNNKNKTNTTQQTKHGAHVALQKALVLYQCLWNGRRCSESLCHTSHMLRKRLSHLRHNEHLRPFPFRTTKNA